jgi:ABC-2 type transport system ATP-binding protein
MSVIDVRNLKKVYGDHVAVEDVSFTVEQGEIFGILGPNGAGKTTTVECVDGLRVRDGGSVDVLGFDPLRHRDEIRKVVGVQLQDSQLPDKIRVAEALDLLSSFYAKPADWRELMDVLGLREKAKTPFGKLSGGQKQRLSIALALVGNPRIAILDELTTGLDPQARRNTWDLIQAVRDRGVTVLLVTHFMEEAERLCDRIALIAGGRVAAIDTPAGMVGRLGSEQRLRFHPSAELDPAVLEAMPQVTEVTRSGSQVVVSGTGNLLQAVSVELSRHGIDALDLRVEQASLEDAFVALTKE